MKMLWVTSPPLLLLVLLLEGIQDVRAATCYKCSYYTHGDTTVPQDCTKVQDCAFCQTRVYRGDSIELVQRDCVTRCLSSGVPVIFMNIKDKSADEMCCTADLCNTHPSSTATSTRTLGVLMLLPTLLLTINTLT